MSEAKMTNPLIDSIESLEKIYHSKIPISKHMGIGVVEYDGSRLLLGAPLSNNINHQSSAFGGSLFSLAALAGWGILQLKLGEEKLDCNTVIAKSEVSYSIPVFSDFLCECVLPTDPVYQQFIKRLSSNNKASLTLESRIICKGKVSMKFEGHYVVLKKDVKKMG